MHRKLSRHAIPCPGPCLPLCFALLCLLACSPPCCASPSCPPPCSAHVLPTAMSCAMSFTLRCSSSHRTNRFALTNTLPPVLPVLCFIMLCIHLDFYLSFFPPCTQLCPCPVLILTSHLYLALACATLPSNSSLLCHSRPTLLPFLSHYPPHPALAPSLLSAMACPYLLSAMPLLPTDLPYLTLSALPVAMF